MTSLDIFLINTILSARIPSAFAYQKSFVLPSCLQANLNSYRRHLSIHLTTDSIQTSTDPIVQDEESTAYYVVPLYAQLHSLCDCFADFCCDRIFDVSTCYPDPTETFQNIIAEIIHKSVPGMITLVNVFFFLFLVLQLQICWNDGNIPQLSASLFSCIQSSSYTLNLLPMSIRLRTDLLFFCINATSWDSQ